MDNLNNILVVVPPARRATAAWHRAMAYAHRTGATLHLCQFDYYGPIDHSRRIFGDEVADRARHDFVEEHMRWLAAEAAGLARQGLRVECDVIWAPEPHKSIVAKAIEVAADLVLKDVDCEPGGEVRLRPSAVDWRLIRLCPAPLMLVHAESRILPRQLLAAVDVMVEGEAGHLNDRVVEAATAFARMGDSAPTVVSVFSYIPIETYASGFIAETYDIMSQAHRESLDGFAARHRLPPAEVVRLRGFDVAERVAVCAKERRADLVVLGSAYKNAFDRLTFGTVAEDMIRKLSCDVLLVKPDNFRAVLARHLDLPATAAPGSRQPLAA